MSILFGHPTGGPFSHHAALAHFERGWLDGFCVPWMPAMATVEMMALLPGMRRWAARFERRAFPPLEGARLVQGRQEEAVRLIKRMYRRKATADEKLAYEANDWLMKTMTRECTRRTVTAVHAYEDCSLSQFQRAKRLGKACIYDMPIGYHPAWLEVQRDLQRRYANWLPGRETTSQYVRPAQKEQEMRLADVVLAPCTFAAQTITQFTAKKVAIARYAVDADFWTMTGARESRPLRFIYTGQISIRKGIPTLLEAWSAANLKHAELHLVGGWHLSDGSLKRLPRNVIYHLPCSRRELRAHYQSSDVFVFPSFFEGFGLVFLEAMACGLPVVATNATAAPDVVDNSSGRIFGAGATEELTELLRWFAADQDRVDAMKLAARRAAERCTWEQYRRDVAATCSRYI